MKASRKTFSDDLSGLLRQVQQTNNDVSRLAGAELFICIDSETTTDEKKCLGDELNSITAYMDKTDFLENATFTQYWDSATYIAGRMHSILHQVMRLSRKGDVYAINHNCQGWKENINTLERISRSLPFYICTLARMSNDLNRYKIKMDNYYERMTDIIKSNIGSSKFEEVKAESIADSSGFGLLSTIKSLDGELLEPEKTFNRLLEELFRRDELSRRAELFRKLSWSEITFNGVPVKIDPYISEFVKVASKIEMMRRKHVEMSIMIAESDGDIVLPAFGEFFKDGILKQMLLRR